MKIYELLEDLKTRHQNAQVLVVESDAPENVFMIESVAGGNEKSVILMGKSARHPAGAILEALVRGAGQVHNVKIYESVEQPGKFQVNVDGLNLLQHFETQADAKLFMQGFTFGFGSGSGSNPATADRS